MLKKSGGSVKVQGCIHIHTKVPEFSIRHGNYISLPAGVLYGIE